LLLLTGDDPTAGDQPDTKPVFDIDSIKLLETAKILRDRAELPSGRKVSGRADFFLGTADLPIDPPPGWRPDKLKAKIAAGAQFAQTQFCMDATIVRRYVSCLAEAGLLRELHLLIGVAPLRSARSVRWMRQHLFGTIIADAILERMEKATDQAAEGSKICVEFLHELAQIPGVAGAHIMAPNNEVAIPEAIEQARAGIRQRAPV
jgi:methylenetetrahydrofolate reductase (NADPH)